MPKPNRNQKSMSDSEKDILAESAKQRKEQEAIDRLNLKKAEKALFEKEKKSLPALLETRIQGLEMALAKELENIEGLPSARIHQLISRASSGLAGYTANELSIVFEAFQELVVKINQRTMFVPDIASFCAFAGFSSNTYNNYLQSPDEQKREVMKMIDDYIKHLLLDASKMRRTDASTSIFVAKAEHNMAEAVNPQVIQYQNTVNIDDVMKKIEAIRSGNVIDAEFNEK